MPRKRVLVITRTVDPTADLLLARMEERSVPVLRLNVDNFAAESMITVQLSRAESDVTLQNSIGTMFGSDNIECVFLRRKPSVTIEDLEDAEAKSFAESEYSLLVYWWLRTLDCRFLDREEAITRASNKVAQLMVARRVGLAVPRTLVTNDPERASEFYAQAEGAVVAKTLGGYGRLEKEGFETIYTSEVNTVQAARFSDLRFAPAILQERIDKQFELRVTVVDRKVFPCRIESQASRRTRIDWRRYDMDRTPYMASDLPEEITDKLMEMMTAFDIHFVAFDLAVTSDGEYVFFEMNPSPQWLWIENLTGLRITDALIDALMAGSTN